MKPKQNTWNNIVWTNGWRPQENIEILDRYECYQFNYLLKRNRICRHVTGKSWVHLLGCQSRFWWSTTQRLVESTECWAPARYSLFPQLHTAQISCCPHITGDLSPISYSYRWATGVHTEPVLFNILSAIYIVDAKLLGFCTLSIIRDSRN
jgi:hypothetical protein